MAMYLKVTISELDAAVSKLKAALDEFESATNACKAAGDELLAGWEGDRQKDFAEQNELNLQWFQQMADAAGLYITALNVAKAAYIALDIVS